MQDGGARAPGDKPKGRAGTPPGVFYCCGVAVAWRVQTIRHSSLAWGVPSDERTKGCRRVAVFLFYASFVALIIHLVHLRLLRNELPLCLAKVVAGVCALVDRDGVG